MKQSNHLVEIVMYEEKKRDPPKFYLSSVKRGTSSDQPVLVSHLLVFRCCFGVFFLWGGGGGGVGDGLSLIWTSHSS